MISQPLTKGSLTFWTHYKEDLFILLMERMVVIEKGDGLLMETIGRPTTSFPVVVVPSSTASSTKTKCGEHGV